METHYGSYYEYSMPTDKFTAYYDSHLKGDDKLHTFIPATIISKKLDEFICLSPEEQLESRILWDIPGEINKLNRNVGFTPGAEGNKRLRTKYACALAIRKLRVIERHQQLIHEHVASPRYGNTYSTTEYNMRFRNVPKELFDKMRWDIDGTHQEIENIRRMDLEDDFRNNVFPHLPNEVSKYYWIMGLDYTPTSKKVEDAAVGCGGHAFIIIIVLFFIFLMAQIMCK